MKTSNIKTVTGWCLVVIYWWGQWNSIMWSKFHAEDLPISRATIQNLVTQNLCTHAYKWLQAEHCGSFYSMEKTFIFVFLNFSGLMVHYCIHQGMCYCWHQKKHHKHKCWEHKGILKINNYEYYIFHSDIIVGVKHNILFLWRHKNQSYLPPPPPPPPTFFFPRVINIYLYDNAKNNNYC